MINTQADHSWWRQAVVYQIYPRSFADGNGDGIGDLRGVINRIDHLRALGVDAVWLSPFYPSALADGGYDVDDYRDIDPRLGTLADFDELTARLHDAGLKMIIDLVPNHSSDRHVWFREALAAGKGSPARARYIFRDGLGPDGSEPPADWPSIFGGPAWEPVGDGQWYLHLFAKEQPDLNWDNPEVRADFLHTLRFWSDRGVDGFRVDVAHGLAKRLPAELPSWSELRTRTGAGQHPLWDRDEVHDIYAEWRSVFNEYTPPRTAVAEAWVDTDRRPSYASADGLGQAFNFDLLQSDYDAPAFRTVITENLDLAARSGSSTTWVLSNHDVVRHPTRYGLPPLGDRDPDSVIAKHGVDWLRSGGTEPKLERELGLRRARAATLIELALPGSAYLYQGEELGLHEVAEIPADQRQDPSFFRSGGEQIGRDGCRVPLPWTATGSSYGFGSGPAHLPQPAWFADLAVEVQDRDPNSTLALYRNALRLRRELQTEESLTWLDTGREDVLAFRRPNGWTCVSNFGSEPYALSGDEVLITSTPFDGDELPGATTVWTKPA